LAWGIRARSTSALGTTPASGWCKDPKYQALVARHEGSGAWLLMPQSFMNASGRAVQMLAGFFKLKPEEILVAHDELDFQPGVVRLKQGGGIAGHNGLRDISQRLGAHDYWRLRIGVGKPPPGTEGGDYVLQKPSPDDRAAIDGAIEKALALLPQMLSGDMQGAMNKLHTEEKPPAKKEPEKKEPPIQEPGKKEPEKKAEPVQSAAAPKAEKKGLFSGILGKKK
jgi:PTH1 family peptidyl-tRNA hydrolase